MAEEGNYVDDDQVEEPELKYKRIANSMNNIITNDAVSCMSVHEKFIAVGTHWGVINLLDHLGFSIENKKINTHCTTVNQISIDEQGDYMASCSDDGRVVVHGLYSTDYNQILNFDRPVKAVAIAPDYVKSRQFVTGDDRLILVSKGYIKRNKTEILHQGEGPIRNIKWRSDFIAWSNDCGVKVYDMNERKLITYVTRGKDEQHLRPELYKCHIQWRNDTTFIIGWGHTVRVCEVKPRVGVATGASASSMPQRYVQISQYFSIPDYICGVASRGSLLLVLIYPREASPAAVSEDRGDSSTTEDVSPRPQMLIADPLVGGYREKSIDELPIRGYEKHKCHNYHLESIPGENTHYIVSPKDVICAQERDMDDHVEWLMDHSRYDEALDMASKNERLLLNYTIQAIGIRYIDHLIATKKFSEAGQVCSKVLKDKESWEVLCYKFVQLGQIASLALYLPVDSPRLDTTIYEMVLNEFLSRDLPAFLNLLQVWPHEGLYNCRIMINAIRDRLDKAEIFTDTRPGQTAGDLSDRDRILWQSQALLFEKEGRYDEAFGICLMLKKPEVFDLITRYNLFQAVNDKIVLLMDLDTPRAIRLLLDNMDKIQITVVVNQLKNTPKLLHDYLDALYTRDAHSGALYHDKLVELYATFNRPKLLPFLRSTDQYNLSDALNLCHSKSFIPETVHLLGRIGRRWDALKLIMENIKDVQQAIDYCREQGERDLWEKLILYSTDKPDFISALMENSGMDIDPRFLIKKIQPGMKIPRLRNSLVKLLNDYQVQVNLRDGCKRILQRDLRTLLDKQIVQQHRAIRVDVPGDVRCAICGAAPSLEALSGGRGGPTRGQAVQSDAFVIFYCRHAFHKGCLSVEPGVNYRCILCDVVRASG